MAAPARRRHVAPACVSHLRLGQRGVNVGNGLACDAADQLAVDGRMNRDVAGFRESRIVEFRKNG